MPLAASSVLFDDWVDDSSTFKVGGHYFYVQYLASTQKLTFKMDNMGGLMLIGECETREEIKYCFEEVNYPQIRVSIESLEPDIIIEREFSTTSPKINEQIKVTVTLRNDGDKTATNVRYTDPYPLALKVFSSKNAGEWQGSLNIGEEEKFTYTIKAEDIISYDSIATLTYESGGKEKTKKSSTAAINVQKPFSIEHKLSTEAADKNEVVIYNLTITNNDESAKLTIENLEIGIPTKITLISAPSELKKEDNKLLFSGAIEHNEKKAFTISIKSASVGTFKISASADLQISGQSFSENYEKSFTVGLSDILPILNVTEEVKSNVQYNVYAAVKNYGKEQIKNVNMKLESDLFSGVETKRDISSGSAYDLFKKTLTAPYTDEDKKYNIKISGSYTSNSGKSYTFEKSAQLTVTAPPKVVQITRELNKEEFYPGDEIRITVKIKNQKSANIENIDISDIFPQEIRSSLLGEVTAELESLGPNQEIKMYSYSVVVPEGYDKEEIEFKTTLNAKLEGELIILKRIDNVKILKGDKPEATEETEQEGSEESEPTGEESVEEQQKEPNVFTKLINWIKNLFKKE